MNENYVILNRQLNQKTMDIQAEKSLIMERFKQVNDSSLIAAIKSLLDYAQGHSTERVSIEEYNKALDQAELEIAQGKGTSHDTFKQEMAKW